jgi:iron complex outermembrane recepter protein
MTYPTKFTCGFKQALATGFFAAVSAAGMVAHADDQPVMPVIVVTGTHIKGTDEGALPVQTITHEQIEQSGAINAEQFLQTVAVAVQGNSNNVAASNSGATTGGESTVSLRGLGSQRTLVLINGRRTAGGGNITDSVSVDVNSIPLSAVERVEVLKDGASAVYGSDAIAGVVNFIIRDNYEGAEIKGYGGGSSDGGGGVQQLNGMVGFGNLADNHYNVLFAANYQKENALYGYQRDFAKSGINVAAGNDVTSAHTFPANVAPLDNSFGFVNPKAPNCAPSVTDPLDSPGTLCAYDPSPYVALLPQAERYSLYSAAHVALTSDLQLYGEASYNQNRQRYVIQPVPLSDAFAIPANNPLATMAPYANGACGGACSTINLAPSSPYYPTAYVRSQTSGPLPVLDIFYRSVLTGNRDLTDTAQQPRAVLGIKGTAADWNFDGGLLYSQTRLTEHDNGGFPLYTGILPLLNSGQVNFFGPNTPAIAAEAQATNYDGDAYTTNTSLAEVSGYASRDIGTLPAGALTIAVGGEFRMEKFSTDPSAAVESGNDSGYGGNFLPQHSQRNVFGVSGELNVPILASLSGNVAARYDHYEGTGAKTTPKVSLLWKPAEQFLMRGSYGRGFRAPSLTELFSPQTLGVSSPGLSDPTRCATTNSEFDCNTQFNIVLGGNTKLRPEISDNYTLGFVVEPLKNFSVGVDGFAIKLQNTIIFGINPSDILANLTEFGSLITRGAQTANCPGCPGPITLIDQVNENFGETDVKGYDIDIRYRVPSTPIGAFSFSLTGSYFATYRIAQPDGSFLNVAGVVSPITNGNGGVIPRWHHYLTATWSRGVWDVTADQNYQSSYEDLPSTITGAVRTVGSYSPIDLQAGYTGIQHVRLEVGARNAFNRNPPYTNAGGQNWFQAGYDPGYVDPRGRFVYGSVTYSFAPRT